MFALNIYTYIEIYESFTPTHTERPESEVLWVKRTKRLDQRHSSKRKQAETNKGQK